MKTNYIEVADCVEAMKQMPDRSIDAVVTSPPYYNAREYSTWGSVDAYLADMRGTFSEVFRLLKNHRYAVVNVGDVTSQVGKAKWSVRKLPLGAYFITMMESLGFQFIDDYIWDKGEPQTKRHMGNPPFPFYQYPVNCYEHVLVFAKHELDKTKIPCPDCHRICTQSNSCTGIGVQSWECKNPECPTKSAHGRGKRFSARSIMMNTYQKPENEIPEETRQLWRRDIVRINPVVKINNKGENVVGHSAPFPESIPEMVCRFFAGAGDVVLDPFMGSGTTAVACIKTGRKYIGFDTCEAYVNKARKRVDEVMP